MSSAKTRPCTMLFLQNSGRGPVELRGLEDRNYSVVDYVTGKTFGTVSGHGAHLPVEFDGHLLLEVRPI